MTKQKAIIKPSHKNAMQSGRVDAYWTLTYPKDNNAIKEPIMGWTSNYNTLSQVKVKFSSLEAAENFAKSKGIDYIVDDNAPDSKLKRQTKSYSDNFDFYRKGAWTH